MGWWVGKLNELFNFFVFHAAAQRHGGRFCWVLWAQVLITHWLGWKNAPGGGT